MLIPSVMYLAVTKLGQRAVTRTLTVLSKVRVPGAGRLTRGFSRSALQRDGRTNVLSSTTRILMGPGLQRMAANPQLAQRLWIPGGGSRLIRTPNLGNSSGRILSVGIRNFMTSVSKYNQKISPVFSSRLRGTLIGAGECFLGVFGVLIFLTMLIPILWAWGKFVVFPIFDWIAKSG